MVLVFMLFSMVVCRCLVFLVCRVMNLLCVSGVVEVLMLNRKGVKRLM